MKSHICHILVALAVAVCCAGCAAGDILFDARRDGRPWYVQRVEFSDRAGHSYKVTMMKPGVRNARVAYMDTIVKIGEEVRGPNSPNSPNSPPASPPTPQPHPRPLSKGRGE